MTRRPSTLTPDYFSGLYAGEPDPWRFATSPYERDKYAATLEALPRSRYASAFEVGCSIGVFTRQLAARCDGLLAIDVVPEVLDRARAFCADFAQVRFDCMAVPAQWPDGLFDLIVLSEVAYYLDRADHARLVQHVRDSVRSGADIVLVHWHGATDYPLSGDEAAELFIAEAKPFASAILGQRTESYRLDVLRTDGSSAGTEA